MNIDEAIWSRRAVREYDGRAVEEAVIRTLVDAAVQAPSAMNRQGWAFSVVTDKGLLADISARSKAHLLATPGFTHSEHDLHAMLADPTFDIFYQAPVLVLISSSGDVPWVIEDSALAAENLMLAARAAGLGSCWIGLAQAWIETPEGKSTLRLSAEFRPVAPIILGYPKAWPAPVPRKSPTIQWIGNRTLDKAPISV
ncbi:Nitroreductase [Sphingomonas sp. YR710]|uniref:nitroreductase family protein n=1 Tax=Sphingomonas sp. YR710 TaxID=1882773 RepID=UPI000890193A|nr:nitroreductase family protein [Sphingomonas sp. YR710]SDD80585.1 Nitroreductase [Sphingomonas sp. YR710]